MQFRAFRKTFGKSTNCALMPSLASPNQLVEATLPCHVQGLKTLCCLQQHMTTVFGLEFEYYTTTTPVYIDVMEFCTERSHTMHLLLSVRA